MADSHAASETHLADDPHAASHDSHGPVDPNAAPMRSDVREQFPISAVLYCALLGAIAIVAGTIVGLTVINN